MKKLASILLLLVMTMTAQAQEASFETTPLEVIDKGWSTKTIDNVINGSLGIMLERFDQTWPTWMVGAVRETMEKGLDKQVLDEETDLTVSIDSKNGFVSVGDGGTDGEYMSACYWNRPNGHKLLAVLVGKPTDPCIEVLCTYDYDPQKKALIPEPSILKGYRWGDKGEYQQIFCKLPRTGKDITVEAVIKQVNAVYDRWNAMRENYKEGMPSLDELFGTREWQQVVAQADSVTRECECGGFFDFGDEGPLDPWTYDCYEGHVSADSIEAEILPNGMAEVKFLVKDAVTIKGIPMRWLMHVEDGEWRVANIFFTVNDNMDLLQGMKEYVWEAKTDKQFDIRKYYDELVELAEPLFAGYDPVEFHEYALIDVDRDGKAELYMRNGESHYEVIFSLDDKDPHILIDADYHRSISFFKDAIQSSGGCGTGCHMAEVVVVKNSKRVYTLNNMEQYDMEGELAENGWEKDGKEIPTEEGERRYKELCEHVDHYVNWHAIDIERKPNLSDYAE